MREIIEARLKGLPDPVPEQTEEEQTTTTEVETKKKNKKKKSKTVPSSAVHHPNNVELIPSSSKFDTLSEWDEMAEPDMIKNDKVYKRNGNFVQISNERPLTLRLVASTLVKNDETKENLSQEENPNEHEVPNKWDADAETGEDFKNEQVPENNNRMSPGKVFSPMSSVIFVCSIITFGKFFSLLQMYFRYPRDSFLVVVPAMIYQNNQKTLRMNKLVKARCFQQMKKYLNLPRRYVENSNSQIFMTHGIVQDYSEKVNSKMGVC